jgi:pimeloyl-ACP methyl ester carboxylesterase
MHGIMLALRGIGSGHPLVIINGFASAMNTWNPQLLALLARKSCRTKFPGILESAKVYCDK